MLKNFADLLLMFIKRPTWRLPRHELNRNPSRCLQFSLPLFDFDLGLSFLDSKFRSLEEWSIRISRVAGIRFDIESSPWG